VYRSIQKLQDISLLKVVCWFKWWSIWTLIVESKCNGTLLGTFFFFIIVATPERIVAQETAGIPQKHTEDQLCAIGGSGILLSRSTTCNVKS